MGKCPQCAPPTSAPTLGRNQSEPALFQYVNVEELVPKKHLLRKIVAKKHMPSSNGEGKCM